MPRCGGERPNRSRHYHYFEEQCRAKGASERKAREWAFRQVQKGKRAPDIIQRRVECSD